MAFFQDPARQPFLRVPPVVAWLIVLFIGIHALRVSLYAPDSYQTNYIFENFGLIPAWYSPAYLAQHGPRGIVQQSAPFLTYMFLHGSWSHVLINSVWLLAFGAVVARRFGTLLFIAFFIACGLAGAATHLAVYWGSTAPVIGASAAISGLMGAGFRMLPFRSRESARQPLAPLLSARIIVWSLMWLFVNVVAGVTGLGTGGGLNVVAWGAHMGGYVAGLLFAGPFDALARREHAEIEDSA